MKDLRSILSSRTTPCKICAGDAAPIGALDFNKSCLGWEKSKLQPCGVLVGYQLCQKCGFIYTNAMDDWSQEDFKDHIYNSQYKDVDPEYDGQRATEETRFLVQILPEKADINALDYGGGEGLLARRLLEAGFPSVDCYDPFIAHYAQVPTKLYNLVICFEALEHVPDPETTISHIAGLLGDTGLVVFSTLLHDGFTEKDGVNAWYIAPRNGHISIFSRASLHILWAKFGFRMGSFTDNVHMAWRNLPDFAAHLLP